MKMWTGRTLSPWEMDHLADVVVAEVKIDYEDKNRKIQVIDFAKFGNAIYLAVERVLKGPGTRDVSAVIILLRIDGMQVRWKDVHESALPSETSCPLRILNQLTPTSSAYAQDWRKACRVTIAKLLRQKGIQPGVIVVTDSPLIFSGSCEAQIFRRESEPEVFTALTEDGREQFKCRIPDKGLGLDFSVWASLDQYLACNMTPADDDDDDDGLDDEFEPWLPQVDDILAAAQLDLF